MSRRSNASRNIQDELARQHRLAALRRILRQQLLQLVQLRAMGRYQRRAPPHLAPPRAPPTGGLSAAERLACLGPPTLPDHFSAVGRIPVANPRYCSEHGWTAQARPGFALPSPRQIIEVSSSSSSPVHSPVYTPASPSPPAEPRRTMAARRGVPPFYTSTGEDSGEAAVATPSAGFFFTELAPPPPPPVAPWFPGRPTAATAANARPGLRHFIPTGHVPAEGGAGDEASHSPPSGEGEA
ncbi:unnamed protein product [Urochloa humidicola]